MSIRKITAVVGLTIIVISICFTLWLECWWAPFSFTGEVSKILVYESIGPGLKKKPQSLVFDGESDDGTKLIAELKKTYRPLIPVLYEDPNYVIEVIYSDENIENIYVAQRHISVKSKDYNRGVFVFRNGVLTSFLDQKIKANQQVDPTVKTPAESGNEQGTAGHP